MGLAAITRDDVLAAVKEFDRLGRDEFLRRYGFRRARSYLLEIEDKLYDSKAIVGYAHGVSQRQALPASAFSGGDQTVARHLRQLGFHVRAARNPVWTRDEVILACALVYENAWRSLDDENPRVIELSRVLQAQRAHPQEARGPDFRNPNGVARKTADIATRHPAYAGVPTHGGKHDREVLQDFLDDPTAMLEEAKRIREQLISGADQAPLPDVDLDGYSADEGQVLQRLHLRRERDPSLRRRVIASRKRSGQAIACEACGFDFRLTYGERGSDYIECHHRVPLHVSGRTVTRAEDLALLCSNCHRVIHRTTPWLTLEQLIELLEANRESRVFGLTAGGSDPNKPLADSG